MRQVAPRRPRGGEALAAVFLRKLAASPERESFLLSGSLLLRAWLACPALPVQLVELRWTGPEEPRAVRAALAEVCRTGTGKRASRDPATWTVRALCSKTTASRRFRVRTSREAVAFDLEVSGSGPVAGMPADLALPLPGGAPPRLLATPREALAAETFARLLSEPRGPRKLERLLHLWLMARALPFDGATFGQAVEIAFRSRKLALPEGTPPSLLDPTVDASDWNALVHPLGLMSGTSDLATALELLRGFLLRTLSRISSGLPVAMTWPAGGPWRPTGFWRYG